MAFDLEKMAAAMRGKRAEADLSIRELAARSGVSPDSIFKYEDAQVVPGADKLWAIADVLGCEPQELMGWGR